MNKIEILNIWIKHVYNKKIKTINKLFDGSCGNQLELAFGLKVNNLNKSDFINFELKQYSSVITFGDWKGLFLFEIDSKISRLDILENII